MTFDLGICYFRQIDESLIMDNGKQLEKEEYAIMLNDLRHNAGDLLDDAFFYYTNTKESDHYRYLALEMLQNALKYAVKAVNFLGESRRK